MLFNFPDGHMIPLLTTILGPVYFDSVAFLQSLFKVVSAQRTPTAIVLPTLAIAALFTKLRRGVQDAIDRRFSVASMTPTEPCSPSQSQRERRQVWDT